MKQATSLNLLGVAFSLLLIPAQVNALGVLDGPQTAARMLQKDQHFVAVADTLTYSKQITAGTLEIATPWLRATPGGAKVAGGYLSITNKGDEPDRLTGVAIPLSAKGEVHEMSTENGVMHMRQLSGGLEIKPGETVVLKPGGYHLMFEGLTGSLKQGDRIEGNLTFAKAGTVSVVFLVGGLADLNPPAEPAPESAH